MRGINIIALVLIIIGGLNWGLVGFFDYNFVDGLLGADSMGARLVYAVIGIAALYKLAVAVGSRTMAKK